MERYIKEFFKAHHHSEIELIVLSEEEDAANVLMLMKDRIDVIQVFNILERLFSHVRRFTH